MAKKRPRRRRVKRANLHLFDPERARHKRIKDERTAHLEQRKARRKRAKRQGQSARQSKLERRRRARGTMRQPKPREPGVSSRRELEPSKRYKRPWRFCVGCDNPIAWDAGRCTYCETADFLQRFRRQYESPFPSGEPIPPKHLERFVASGELRLEPRKL